MIIPHSFIVGTAVAVAVVANTTAIVWVGASHVAVFTPPQFGFPIPGRTIYPGSSQAQLLPVAFNSTALAFPPQFPPPQPIQTAHVLPLHDQEPLVPSRR
jgi:hypothetical protein